MAHGLESRVPLVDSELVRFAATMPANVKFKNGTLKSVLKNAMGDVLPSAVLARKDKMGFPVPLVDWMQREGPVREFVLDLFHSRSTRERGIVNHKSALAALEHEGRYGRKVWGLLGLELWQRTFHDGSSAKRFSFDV